MADELPPLSNNSGNPLPTAEPSVPAQLTPLAEPDYWAISRQPWTSLLFSLPLLFIYEAGVFMQPPHELRNGAEVWLRQGLAALGFGGHYFLLPILVVLVLVIWQYLAHLSWKVHREVFLPMAIESVILAVILYLIARLQARWFPSTLLMLAGEEANFLSKLVNFFGAGFYEEVLFRLIMVPLGMLLFKQFGLTESAAWRWSIIAVAVLFAVAHHLGSVGEPWSLYALTFRTIAGIFFGVLFVWRGFGITAWSHALYDIIVGLW